MQIIERSAVILKKKKWKRPDIKFTWKFSTIFSFFRKKKNELFSVRILFHKYIRGNSRDDILHAFRSLYTLKSERHTFIASFTRAMMCVLQWG